MRTIYSMNLAVIINLGVTASVGRGQGAVFAIQLVSVDRSESCGNRQMYPRTGRLNVLVTT